MTQITSRRWRSLIRVEYFDRSTVAFIIPGWDAEIEVERPMDSLPFGIRCFIEDGRKYFHAMVNIGAESADDLVFEDWEPE